MTIKHTSPSNLQLRDDENTGFNVNYRVSRGGELIITFVGVVEGRRLATTVHKLPIDEAYSFADRLFDGIRDLEDYLLLKPQDFKTALNFDISNTNED